MINNHYQYKYPFRSITLQFVLICCQMYWYSLRLMSAHWLNNRNSCGSSQRQTCQQVLILLPFFKLPHKEDDQFIPADLFECEPWKEHDTVLHHLHPPAVFVWCCSFTVFAAACEQRMGLQHGGRMGGGRQHGTLFVTDRKCSLFSLTPCWFEISICLLNSCNIWEVNVNLLEKLFKCSKLDTNDVCCSRYMSHDSYRNWMKGFLQQGHKCIYVAW